MQKEIHPQYYDNAAVACVCGATFTVGSTLEKIQVEICSACHPLFTGKQKILDSAGRVEQFKKRQTKSAEIKAKAKSKRARRQNERS